MCAGTKEGLLVVEVQVVLVVHVILFHNLKWLFVSIHSFIEK